MKPVKSTALKKAEADRLRGLIDKQTDFLTKLTRVKIPDAKTLNPGQESSSKKQVNRILEGTTFTPEAQGNIAKALGLDDTDALWKILRPRRPRKTPSASKPLRSPAPAAAAQRAYLQAVLAECTQLRLKSIDPGAARPGVQPLQLKQVYVDLDLTLDIPKKWNLSGYLHTRDHVRRSSKQNFEAEILADARDKQTRPVAALEALAHHDRLVLLGAPGSGKSTFTAFLAATLAEALSLGKKADQVPVLARLGSEWNHGPLLPVRVILRHFGASLPPDLEQGRAVHLWEYIESELKSCGLNAAAAAVPRVMAEQSGALFLFDGLDESREETTRARVLECVAEFCRTAGPRCRFLITARPYAWEAFRDKRVSPEGSTPAEIAGMHVHYTLADFDADKIAQFIGRWYAAVQEAGWPVSECASKVAELQNAVRRPDLAMLARNPLLLTLMATLHCNRARLPDDRADLYHEVVELLLQRWNETSGADRGLLDALDIPSLRLGDLRDVMQDLAYAAHEAHVGKQGVADIPEGELVAGLKVVLLDGSKADLALDYIEKRAGLLLGQGELGRQRRYTFPHRTFQEYLAACHLAGQPDFREKAVTLAEMHPFHWREVLLLAARVAGHAQGVPVADALVHSSSPSDRATIRTLDDADWRRAILAGEQILEIGRAAVENRLIHQPILKRIRDWLVALIEGGHLPNGERDQAGQVLGRLGDPRPGVGVKEGVPDMAWIDIPAGPFTMGEGSGQFTCNLIQEPFSISRFPLTVAQFQSFVEAGGYGKDGERYWSRTGLTWRKKRKVLAPVDDDPVFQCSNAPRVGVSWFEAQAYCNWLAAKLDLDVRLPSEVEWERAARHTDGRPYPWGEDDDLERRCNCRKSKVGHSSTVGLFPLGGAECGVQDMAGNVWEWCRTIYRSNSKDYEDKVEDDPEKAGPRVLRGGSWGLVSPVYFRCAYRSASAPFIVTAASVFVVLWLAVRLVRWLLNPLNFNAFTLFLSKPDLRICPYTISF